VRKVAEENGVDVSQSIAELENRAQQVRFFLVCDALERERERPLAHPRCVAIEA
jgi:hypothetical protein